MNPPVYISSAAAGLGTHRPGTSSTFPSSPNPEAAVNRPDPGYRPGLLDTPARRRVSHEAKRDHAAGQLAEALAALDPADIEAARSPQSSIGGPEPADDARWSRRWPWQQGEADGEVTKVRKAAFSKHWLQRLLLHLCAALALIIPMLIMSIDPSLVKSLVTSSVFIVVFAVGVALSTLFGDGESITATAAYAAVLFVFVGASLGQGGALD